MTFEEWLDVANRYCISKVGLSLNDLPDTSYAYDYYDDCLSKSDLIESAIEYVQDILEDEDVDELGLI